jgi:hypothetical protein
LGIRETMNRHPKISAAVVACAIGIGAVAIGIEIRSNSGAPPAENFFTIDDGKTWFADSVSNLPPFDYNGAKAVRCYVFKGKNGTFAGLLEKYSDDTLQQLAHETNKPSSIPVMVKKPGEKEWKNVGPDQEAMMLMHTTASDGSDAENVMP